MADSLAIIMASHTNYCETAFGITLTGRNAIIPSITTMVDPTIKTIPFTAAWREDTTIRAFLEDV
ncbi:hypothetical protein LY76DRAFT_598925 [Colletotrichum caudatum]|nr:hypothetical protein LY76DRAFT_598925 [Colletotrichum caudatum]